jgi:hypothetical protein
MVTATPTSSGVTIERYEVLVDGLVVYSWRTLEMATESAEDLRRRGYAATIRAVLR